MYERMDKGTPWNAPPPPDVKNFPLTGNLQLPFNVSWQQVKDYVRQACAVDHVEIFQKSTCGWVRVLEKENFEAAFGTTRSPLCKTACMISSSHRWDTGCVQVN